ncbi:MAG: hypothetical protein [Caudoviricetes sp.]|nr:MAG: hypothetical protein [Caudoviricetes sp.]
MFHLIRKDTAKALGFKHYFDGHQCEHGFYWLRKTRSGECVCPKHKDKSLQTKREYARNVRNGSYTPSANNSAGRTNKSVSFHRVNDKLILDHALKQPEGFSDYIKKLIKQDMQPH